MLNKNQGFLKLILIIIIAIIILSYFGFDLRSIIEAERTQTNLDYVWGIVTNVWDTYLVEPVSYLWNDVFIDLIWESFIDNLERIKAGQPTTIEEMAPAVNNIQ